MKNLKKGTSAIPFKGIDLDGNTIDFKDFKGQKVLLSFFRKAACPFCNMGLQELIKRHEEFEKRYHFFLNKI